MKELIFHGAGVVIGGGSIRSVGALQIKRLFVVTGEGSVFRNGTIDKLKGAFEGKECEIQIYSGIKKNPDTEAVLEGVARMREFKPDYIAAVGGGSPIDAAKLMCLFYDYPELDFERAAAGSMPEELKTVRLIAIPTTSGTGTEVTRSAVVTYKANNLKIGLKSKAFIPYLAVLDPELTQTMPKNIAAETGMDAMTHAVECFINKNIDEFTACLASGAVEGLFKHLVLSCEGNSLVHREKVHYFQSMAGMAFANVGLGIAHGISHAIGGMYDLGHGLLNAVVLPYALKYNTRDPEVQERLNYLGDRIKEKDFIRAIVNLNNKLKIPACFRDLAIEERDYLNRIEELTSNSLKGSTRVNPVPITYDEMKELLLDIYYKRL